MTLSTVNVCRKYLSYGDIQNINPLEFNYFSFKPWVTFKALACHHTQFVWFRKLFIIFSRYTWVNSFRYYEHPNSKFRKKSVSGEQELETILQKDKKL